MPFEEPNVFPKPFDYIDPLLIMDIFSKSSIPGILELISRMLYCDWVSECLFEFLSDIFEEILDCLSKSGTVLVRDL